MLYPKIETLYDRDPDNMKRVLRDKIRLPEFALIKSWLVTEKIDGTNVRITLSDGSVRYGGRTDNAQMPMHLLDFLQDALPAERVAAAFDEGSEAVVFGEGYGPKIQSGGAYRPDISLRLFDVAVRSEDNWLWLSWANVENVAAKLGLSTVSSLGEMPLEQAVALTIGDSLAAAMEGGTGRRREGIVARTEPQLLTRRGERLMWKLKERDLG